MRQAPQGIPDAKPILKKQPNNRRALMIGGILLVLVLVLIGGIGLWNSNPGFQRIFEPNCTVGVVGTGVTITLEGWKAPQGCSFFVNGSPVPGMQFTASPQTPTGPAVCAGQWKIVYIIVRDQSNTTPTSTEICRRLLHTTPTSGG